MFYSLKLEGILSSIVSFKKIDNYCTITMVKSKGIFMDNYVYILRCSDDTLYTGWTNDLMARLKQHQNKKGAKYTRVRTPLTLVYFESYDTKQEAMKREYQIKQYQRKKKLELVDGFDKSKLLMLTKS